MEACAAPRYRADSSLHRRVPNFSLAPLAGTRLHCACSSKQRNKAWKAAQASLMNGSSAGGPVHQNEQEVNVVEGVALLLSSCERLKAMIDLSSSSGVGPDMRNRVEHLLQRVDSLKQSAELATRATNGRMPSQLVASLKALQREHGSIENIVRLATQAGPVLMQPESGLSVVAPKDIVSMSYKLGVKLEKREENETSVEVLSGPKYEMSTTLSENTHKLTAVRAEIERRVMEQLTKKQGLRSILDSKQDIRKENERKLAELQKVPSVKTRSLEDKSEVDTPMLTGKGFSSQMVEVQEVGYLMASDPVCDMYEARIDTEHREMENAKFIPSEVHEQSVQKLERALLELREQISELTNDLRRKEDAMLALEEKLMSEKRHLVEKIKELSGEVMKRLTAEQLNHTFGKSILGMEEDLKRAQSQLATLGSELYKKEKTLEGHQEQQERIREELQACIISLEGRLREREVVYEAFNPQTAIVELGSIRVEMRALQEAQLLEQSQMADWQAKLEKFERSVLSSVQQIKDLTSEAEGRMRDEEVENVLRKALDGVDKQSMKLRELTERVSREQSTTASSLGLLQQEWSAHRKGLQAQLEDLKEWFLSLERTHNEGVLSEVSNINDRLNDMHEQHKHQRSLILETRQQMVAFEGKVFDLFKKMIEDAEEKKLDLLKESNAHRWELQAQLEDVKEKLLCLEGTQIQCVVSEVSNINNMLSDMKEEQKVQRSLIMETHQQMVALESKMSKDAELERQELRKEVQNLVTDLLRNSPILKIENKDEVLSSEDLKATPKDMTCTGDLEIPSSVPVLSSNFSADIPKNEQLEATLQGGAQQVHDKGTASLEAFFSVMGQLIRDELTRTDQTSARTLPLAELSISGEPTQDGESSKQTIILRYDSSWKKAFIHYRADNLGWSDVPGVPMQEASTSDGKSWKEFKIKAARLEFVVTDGQGNWDRAPNGHNYLLEKPGIFELGAGVLKLASSY